MTQQISPFLEAKWGWDYGESNWNNGMDENMLKFSFMFNRNINGVISSLPAIVNGEAYFLTTDNRIYFAANSNWYSTPTPKWFLLVIKNTGETYQFNGTSIVQVPSNSELQNQLTPITATIANLKSAAFQETGYFATQGALDVVTANSSNYTDSKIAAIKADFLSPADVLSKTVPVTVNTITTSYALAVGYGGSTFIRYAGSYAADGYCIISDSTGAKFKSVQIPTPSLFGAVPGTDITAALQRFCNYAATHNETVDWTIRGTLSSSVTATVGVGSTEYSRNIVGKISLLEGNTNITDLLKFSGFVQTTFSDGEYIGSILFASRKVRNAFIFDGCKYCDAGDFYVVGCIRYGIDLRNYTTEFNFSHIKTLYCGSSTFQGVAFSAPTHFRTGTDLTQRSNFQGFTSPAGVQTGDGLLINNSYYHIRTIDTAGGTLQCFPALDTVDLANIAGAYWIFGGGFHHGGGETNAGYITRFSGLVNAHDIVCDDLYPVSVGKAASQLSAVQVRVGVDRDSAYRGGSIADTYTENTKISCVILAQGGDVSTGTPYGFGHVGQYTPLKPFQFLDYINDDLSKNTLRNTPVVINDFNKKSFVPAGTQSPEVNTAGGNTSITTILVQEVGGGYGKTVKLVADPVMLSAHGYYTLAFFLVGATTGNPGVVALTGGSGFTVNSEASHNITLTGPTDIRAMLIGTNWVVSKSTTYVTA